MRTYVRRVKAHLTIGLCAVDRDAALAAFVALNAKFDG
jgi:hypothetical protein